MAVIRVLDFETGEVAYTVATPSETPKLDDDPSDRRSPSPDVRLATFLALRDTEDATERALTNPTASQDESDIVTRLRAEVRTTANAVSRLRTRQKVAALAIARGDAKAKARYEQLVREIAAKEAEKTRLQDALDAAIEADREQRERVTMAEKERLTSGASISARELQEVAAAWDEAVLVFKTRTQHLLDAGARLDGFRAVTHKPGLSEVSLRCALAYQLGPDLSRMLDLATTVGDQSLATIVDAIWRTWIRKNS